MQSEAEIARKSIMKIQIPDSINTDIPSPIPTSPFQHSSFNMISSNSDNRSAKYDGNDWEWKVIELLVSAQITSFLQNPVKMQGTIPSLSSKSVNLSTGSSSKSISETDQNRTDLSNQRHGISNFSLPKSQLRSPDSRASSTLSTNNFVDPQLSVKDDKSTPEASTATSGIDMTKNRRRMLIYECRKLRNEIAQYEEEFANVHKRNPRSADRGHMQPVYVEYKNLKRIVRDEAARDIQRIYRGMAARMELQLVLEMMASEGKVGGEGKPHYARLIQPTRLLAKRSHSDSACDSDDNSVAVSTPGGSLGGSSPRSQTDRDTSLHMQRKRKEPERAPYVLWLSQSNVTEMRNKYRDLHTQKQALKSQLKRFDEEFKHVHGRLPVRKEKESMRATYEKYHEIKQNIARAKADLDTSYGSEVPDEVLLSEESPRDRDKSKRAGSDPATVGEPQSDQLKQTQSRRDDKDRGGGNGGRGGGLALRVTDFEDSLDLSQSIGSGGVTHYTSGSGSNRDSGAESPAYRLLPTNSAAQGTESKTSTAHDAQSQSRGNAPVFDTNELVAEKKRLFELLKIYERDFVRLHGRPVTRLEDIAKVANEYKRYKTMSEETSYNFEGRDNFGKKTFPQPAPIVLNFNHVAKAVIDLEISREFYSNFLGFEVIPRPPFECEGYWMMGGGTFLHLVQARDCHDTKQATKLRLDSFANSFPRFDHIAFLTTDMSAFESKLQEAGIDFKCDYHPTFGLRQLFFCDPDGNIIEISNCAPPVGSTRCSSEECRTDNESRSDHGSEFIHISHSSQ